MLPDRWVGPWQNERTAAAQWRVFTVTMSFAIPLVAAVVAIAEMAHRPLTTGGLAPSGRAISRRSAPMSRAIQVRLDAALEAALDDAIVQKLERIEKHARSRGHQSLTRGGMIREAVKAYITPIIDALERNGVLTDDQEKNLPKAANSGRAYKDATRVRLDDNLLRQLDRIESYARGRLGLRHVNRSTLIRDGVAAYLSAFEKSSNLGKPTPPQRRAAREATSGSKPDPD